MAWRYDGEDHCGDCGKISEVNHEGICKKCHDNPPDEEEEGCEECNQDIDECRCSDDRGDGDFNERGGYTRSYINWINNGF